MSGQPCRRCTENAAGPVVDYRTEWLFVTPDEDDDCREDCHGGDDVEQVTVEPVHDDDQAAGFGVLT
jgi:hypothetical protein